MLSASLALLVVAAPDLDARFRSARQIDNLGRFLEGYVGDCDRDEPEFDATACEEAAKRFRSSRRGRVHKVTLSTKPSQIELAGWDDRKSAYRVHLTPFFGERGLGLTVGRPKASKDGLPSVKNIPIWVKLPKGEPDFAFRRQLMRGMLRIELLFEPGGPWALRKRRGEGYRGASVKLIGLRLYSGRGNKLLAEQRY